MALTEQPLDPDGPPDGAAAATPRSPARLRLALLTLTAVLLALAVVAGASRSDEPVATGPVPGRAVGRDAAARGAAPTLALQLGVEEEPASTMATLPPLPLPDPLPADPYAPTPQIVLGRLEIPKLGVIEDLQQGMTLTAINRGPGHWPGTALPGERGNMVIAGHRTTYSKPFNRLDELVAGDVVLFHMPEGTITYEVRGVIVVPAQNIGIASQSYAHTATLFACHPKGSATHRIVAKLRLRNPDGTYPDEDAILPPIERGLDPVVDTTLLVRSLPDQPVGGADPFAGTGG